MSTSPFMNIRDGTERKVSFSARDALGDKIDKLTLMMCRLAAKRVMRKDPSTPKYIKVRGSHLQSQNRSYNQILPLDSRIGGWGRDNHPTVGQFLTREQTRYRYRKVEDRGNNQYQIW